MQPWMSNKKFDLIRADIEHLIDALCKYKESQNEKMKVQHHLIEPRNVEEYSSPITWPPTSLSSLPQYHDLERGLLDMPLYQPLYVNDLAPADRFEQRKWPCLFHLAFCSTNLLMATTLLH